jgi:hypothetical protein
MTRRRGGCKHGGEGRKQRVGEGRKYVGDGSKRVGGG